MFFGALVTVLLAIDLGLFHRHSRETSIREAAISTVVWCSLALAFNGYVWWASDGATAIEFLMGYLVEWMLSMDNVFVFAIIFAYFGVPRLYQYRVLFWGILGAVVLRLTFILIGAALIRQAHFVVYLLGLFLVYTGIKLIRQEEQFDPEASWVVRAARRVFRVAREEHGEWFFAREGGKLCITTLFLVLLVIDFVDVVFAIDSVPAIFGITNNTFIVFTSNIFAILGLRALYFLLAGAMDMFRYLRYGLAAILIFVGLKMLVSDLIEEHLLGGGKIPAWVSLPVIVVFLAVAIGASLIAARREERQRSAALDRESGDKLNDEDDENGDDQDRRNGDDAARAAHSVDEEHRG